MQLTISKENAEVLAVFVKRVTYDDAYRRSHGETEEDRKAMAYRILEALSEVEACLTKAGYAPR